MIRKKNSISPSDSRVLQFIQNYFGKHGYSPSLREIGETCDMSTSVSSFHLVRLEHLGYLTRDYKISRSIVLTKRGKRHDLPTGSA